MSVDGGSTSPLLGSFFMGMSEAVGGSETLDSRGLAAAFEAGLAKLRAQTPAKSGDKTMVDALVPAVEALRQAAEPAAEPPACSPRPPRPPSAGAESTSDLQARFGRAGTSARARSATSIPAPRRSRCSSPASATGRSRDWSTLRSCRPLALVSLRRHNGPFPDSTSSLLTPELLPSCLKQPTTSTPKTTASAFPQKHRRFLPQGLGPSRLGHERPAGTRSSTPRAATP